MKSKTPTNLEFTPTEAALQGDHVVVKLKVTEQVIDTFVQQAHRGNDAFAKVEVAFAQQQDQARFSDAPKHPEGEQFEQWVQEQREAPTPAQAAEVNQRANPSTIVAEHVAELAWKAHGRRANVAELAAGILKYLDYARSELHVERPEGQAGDILWHVNLTLANAGVSPEKAMVSALQMLAKFQVDLYSQNAAIRRRLKVLEEKEELRDYQRTELLWCVQQLELALKEALPGWGGVAMTPELRAEVEAVEFVQHDAEEGSEEGGEAEEEEPPEGETIQ